jgi:hypothetical protein
MKSQSLMFFRTASLALGISAIVACRASAPTTNQTSVTPPNQPAASASNSNEQAASAPAATAANANQPAAAATAACPDCWVQVFDDKNFDPTDDNHLICGPGKWANLRNLTGAIKPNWGDEIESLRVGPRATVMVWGAENYTGTNLTLNPGSAIPSLKASNPTLSDNISSIEIRCN